MTDKVQPTPAPDGKQDWRYFLKDLLETLLLSAALFFSINIVSARVRVDGISMQPTLEDGEFLLVNRLAYRFGNFQRGDIIIFRPPTESHEDYVKRIIGLPGDTVEVKDGRVFINSSLLAEPYIAAAPDYTGVWNVPDDCLFVLGDNRNNSLDSHSWDFLETKEVIGKAILIYWPFADWMILSHSQAVMAAP